MKKRPLSVKIISICYLLAPLGNVLQIAWFNHWPLLGPRSVFNHLSIYEWAILACFPIVSYGIYRVTRAGYFLFIAFSAFLILHNSWAFLVNPSYNMNVVLLFQFLTVGTVGFFLQKHLVAPYFNPHMKWWERDHRYTVKLAARVGSRQNKGDCTILDISKGGCFISTNLNLALGDHTEVSVGIDDIYFRGVGRVMWVTKNPVTGYGLMFVEQNFGDKRILRTLLNALRQTNSPFNSKSSEDVSQSA